MRISHSIIKFLNLLKIYPFTRCQQFRLANNQSEPGFIYWRTKSQQTSFLVQSPVLWFIQIISCKNINFVYSLHFFHTQIVNNSWIKLFLLLFVSSHFCSRLETLFVLGKHNMILTRSQNCCPCWPHRAESRRPGRPAQCRRPPRSGHTWPRCGVSMYTVFRKYA